MAKQRTFPQAPPRKNSASAYWELQRRCAIIAGSVNVLMLLVFKNVGLTPLAWMSVGSILAYMLAYWCLQQRRNRLAVQIMWAETIIHAGFGFLLAGPEGGAHYYLLLFFPALFLGTSAKKAILPAIGVLALYFGLDLWVYIAGPIEQVSKLHLALMRYFNSAVLAGLLSYLAVYYRQRIVFSEGQLRIWASSDPLTGLANRREMDLTILKLDAEGLPSEPAAIMADIDHFKTINDRFGHDGGDMVLKSVADAIRTCVRDTDYVARWGGEEFLIILAEGGGEQGGDVAERIRAAVARIALPELLRDGVPMSVTMTLGVARRSPGEPLRSTIRKADESLYLGKRHGRNRVCHYERDVAATAV